MSEPHYARHWRLTPGSHAVPDGTGGLLLTTPTEEIAQVELPGPDRDLLLEVFAGLCPPAGALERAVDVELLREVLEAAEAEGITGPVPEQHDPAPRTAAVAGDNPLADAVRPVLAAAGFGTAAADDAHVLVACAGFLPDEHWQRLDQQQAEAGRPWHRACLEGDRIVLGPFTVFPHGPTYRDTRTRRLASSSWPDELEALWRHLDAGKALPPEPWPDAGILAVAAGLIVADLCAHRDGRRPAGADRQVVIDPHTATWQAHPVLPVPTGIMRTTP